ncbi:unnamed protein product [Lactuca virosa]|uniref:Uncharacterized protein n=1 Tax=Lactuca virosa TaxID=75947 RepID=A0AAU9MFE5_9ASTR|nr:unnamed protein product [Lactuca virosa]
MEASSLIYAVVGLATVVLLHLACQLRRPTKPNLPPGPNPWPIIGNLNLMGSLPHRSIHELTHKYGDIMHLKFGSFHVVVASSAEMAKVFLKTMDSNFICRPKMAAGKYTTYNYSDIVWSPYGSYWQQARKLCIVELFSAKRLDSFEYIRVEEMKSLLKVVHKSSGESIVLKDLLWTVSFNIISRMALGKRYLEESVAGNLTMSSKQVKTMFEEMFLLNGVLNIGDWIPWIAFMDLQGYVKRMKTVSKNFDGFLEHVLNEHDACRKAEPPETFVPADMVDLLLQIADDPTLEVKLERHGIKAFTLDMLAGGTESSTIIIEWAMAELLKNPEILEKAREELDRVIGRERWVEEKDMSDLHYIKAIVKETMRLHPVVPLLVPRRTREDCKVAGYDIPKDTIVFVSVWTIGRDQELWDKPLDFFPDRFIENDIDVKGYNSELLPFGAGKMTKEELQMKEVFGLSTPKEIPLTTVAHPRLGFKMYSL